MMSKSSTILSRISSETSLHAAWKKLNKSNKTSRDASNVSIKEFESNIHKHITEISKQLHEGSYTFGKVKGVAIKKKDGSPRPLRVPQIKDRLVHKALAIEFEELLSSKFNLKNDVSFAYQKGIGIVDAIVQMCSYYNQGYTIILEADIKKFFPSVNSEQLLNKVEDALPDTSVNDLFRSAVTQEISNIQELRNRKVYEEHFENSESGIPQGNALSPLLANIWLADFDQRMILEGFKMVRYADDFIIMCKTKGMASRAYEIAHEELTTKLGLHLYPLKMKEHENEKVSRILDPRGVSFSFLSIQFDGTRCWVSESKVQSLIEKIRSITSMEERKKETLVEIYLLQCLIKIKNLLDGWIAAYYFIDIEKQLIEIDKHVNVELYKLFTSFNFNLRTHDLDKISLKGRSNTRLGLTSIQRKFTGIPSCVQRLKKVRLGRDTINTLVATNIELSSLNLTSTS